MLLIVHQFAVSKLYKNFGLEEAPELSQKGFDNESLVSILDSYESKEIFSVMHQKIKTKIELSKKNSFLRKLYLDPIS